MSKGKIALIVIGVIFVLSVIGDHNSPSTGGGNPGTSTGGGNPGISTGFGSADASADVTLGTCSVDYGLVTCGVDITNSSDGTSDYYIEAEIDDASGTNVGAANAFATHVAAGQSAKTDLTGVVSSGGGDNVTVKITQVQRTASA